MWIWLRRRIVRPNGNGGDEEHETLVLHHALGDNTDKNVAWIWTGPNQLLITKKLKMTGNAIDVCVREQLACHVLLDPECICTNWLILHYRRWVRSLQSNAQTSGNLRIKKQHLTFFPTAQPDKFVMSRVYTCTVHASFLDCRNHWRRRRLIRPRHFPKFYEHFHALQDIRRRDKDLHMFAFPFGKTNDCKAEFRHQRNQSYS